MKQKSPRRRLPDSSRRGLVLSLSREYGDLLDRVLSKVPRKVESSERFEMPKPICEAVGNKTAIANFQEMASKIDRDPKHLLKFLSKEMATAGAQVGGRAVFQGRFPIVTIKRLFEIYLEKYVVCPICNSPDTKVVREGKFHFLVCEACGAKSSILES